MSGTTSIQDPNLGGADWLSPRNFLLMLAAMLLVVFPKVALGINTFFYRDFGAYCYPLTFFTRTSLLHGEIPLWDPYSQCGVPLMAQLGQWYPPTLLTLFLPMPWSENFLILAHLLWGGFGAYWLARRWKTGTFAASVAGIAYVFNGVTLSSLIWFTYIAALSWLPWVIVCVQEAWRKGGRWIVLAALASAFQVLAGMPEISVLTWLFLIALWINALSVRETKLWPSIARIVGLLLLAAGITMVQMLPFFDLLIHSQRNVNTATDIWSMPVWGWANFLVPLFHCYQAPQGTWFQHGQDMLPSYYLGAGVMTLAIVGSWLAKKRFKALLISITLFCWIMALGSHGLVYVWIRHLIPLIGIARFPLKFAILPALLVPLLMALGIEYLQKNTDRQTHICVAAVVFAVLMVMGILLWLAWQFPLPSDQWNTTAWNTLERALLMLFLVGGLGYLPKLEKRMNRAALQLALLIVVPLDALTHSPGIAPTLPSAGLAPGMWQASDPQPPPKLGEGRIMITPDAEEQFLYSHVRDMNADLIGKRLGEWYNFNLLDGIPKTTGALPLHSKYFDVLEQYLYYTIGSHCGRGLVDFLSVAWLSSAQNPTRWLARTNFLPLITGGQKPVFVDDKKALSAITDSDFDPLKVVYLPNAERKAVIVSNQTKCDVTAIRFKLNQVKADVNASATSLVVISQNYYHLWHAMIDDKTTSLLRANLAFQAIEVPPGVHHIKLIYRDPILKIGAAISVLSLSICGLICLRAPKIRQKP